MGIAAFLPPSFLENGQKKLLLLPDDPAFSVPPPVPLSLALAPR